MLNIDNLLTAAYKGRKVLAKATQNGYEAAKENTPYKDCSIFEIDNIVYDILLMHDNNLNQYIDYTLTIYTKCGKSIAHTWGTSPYDSNYYNFEDIFILPN